MARSFLLSADVANGLNPGFFHNEIYAEGLAPALNKGIVVSKDRNGDMTTEPWAFVLATRIAERAGTGQEIQREFQHTRYLQCIERIVNSVRKSLRCRWWWNNRPNDLSADWNPSHGCRNANAQHALNSRNLRVERPSNRCGFLRIVLPKLGGTPERHELLLMFRAILSPLFGHANRIECFQLILLVHKTETCGERE